MFYIIMCEKDTGIVLELDGKTRFTRKSIDDVTPYFSFSTLEEAEEKALVLSLSSDKLEIAIYNKDWSFIKRIES